MRPLTPARKHSPFSSKILGTGSYLPEKSVSNLDLEKLVETSDEWIRERTGIESRHMAAPDEATSDLSYHAAVLAMEAAGVTAQDLDAIILATVTPDHSLPNTACILQARLGCRPILAFDLSAACSGFVYALSMADHLIRGGSYRHILVIGAETLSRIVNYTDRQTCILFGDGAGAAIVSRTEEGDGKSEIFSAAMSSDGEGGKFLIVPEGGSRAPITPANVGGPGNYVNMEGREIFKTAVNTMKLLSRRVLAESEMSVAEVDWFIFHQANLRIVETLARQMEISSEKLMSNIATVGNTSSASIPILLDESIRSGKVKRDQILLLAAFGAGLTSGAVLMRY